MARRGARCGRPTDRSALVIAYGEDHPQLIDDGFSAVLLILDGLGDRAIPELGGATPSEAANTPNLDSLARRAANGIHVPFGPGRATSSEHAHWAMFGGDLTEFPGRSVLEFAGAHRTPQTGVLYLYGSLRPSMLRLDGTRWITGRASRGIDDTDCLELLTAIAPWSNGHLDIALHHRGRGECILAVSGAQSSAITDSDPLFEHLHPWMKPLAINSAAETTAESLTAYLRWAQRVLEAHPTNQARTARDIPALNVLTTKWPGMGGHTPTFVDLAGVEGAIVSDTNLYRGFAQLLEMRNVHLHIDDDPTLDMTRRLDAAKQLISDGVPFVQVHLKATDEAGHTKSPHAKRDLLERLDPALAVLLDPPFSTCALAVTGDHATPSVHGVLHTGDPTPFCLYSPSQRPDDVHRFGERFAASGSLGRLAARDVLPSLMNAANRPAFSGTRTAPRAASALTDHPEAIRM